MKGNGGLEVAYTPSWILHINFLIYVATVASSHTCMLFVLTTLNIKFCDLKFFYIAVRYAGDPFMFNSSILKFHCLESSPYIW